MSGGNVGKNCLYSPFSDNFGESLIYYERVIFLQSKNIRGEEEVKCKRHGLETNMKLNNARRGSNPLRARNVSNMNEGKYNEDEIFLRDFRVENKCSHPITILGTDGNEVIHLDRCDEPARITNEKEFVTDMKVHGKEVPFYTTCGGNITNLPDYEEGKLLIVSRMVKERALTRIDLCTPCEFQRDDEGNVIGAKGLLVNPEVFRSPDDREEYPRWHTCEVCDSIIDGSADWGDDIVAGRVRYVYQLPRYGIRKHLTVQVPSIRKEFDFYVQGGELVVLETGHSDDKPLKVDERVM